MIYLLTYWAITTAIGVYWIIKHPSAYDDQEHFTIAEIVAYIFPSAMISWAVVPFALLHQIKFKR